MSWPASLLVAFLTAAVGCVVAGAIALLCVDWYRISSFEGTSGYYVVALALVGLVVGCVIGLAASRIVARTLHPTFARSIGASLLSVLAIGGAIAGVARLMADVPPRIAGEELLLAVEVRWPASQTTNPAADGVLRHLTLRALSGNTSRRSTDGPLWMEDAHLVDGRWIVPGAVELFTSRGGRMLVIEPSPAGKANGYLLPLPAYPGARQLQWSEWMPRARAGTPPLPDGVSVRFRVLPRSQPVRTQRFGAFDVATIAEGFHDDMSMGVHRMAATATFRIGYRGTPVTIDGAREGEPGTPVKYDRASAVALLPGAPDGLLIRAATADEAGPFYLVYGDGAHVRSEYAAPGMLRLEAPIVTNDAARFHDARKHEPVPGVVDATTYAQPGDYLFDGALVSTQPPSVQHFEASRDQRLDPNARPLGISPDRHRIVRIGFSEDYRSRALVVTDVRSGASEYLPVDAARMRVFDPSALDPAWLQHYYAWSPNADGSSRLVARTNVTPLPWRGVLDETSGDGYREYKVGPAGRALFDAMATFLTTELGAAPSADDTASSSRELRIGGQLVHLFENEHHHVAIYMDRESDSRLVARIAERFDAALATGKYDALFTTDADSTTAH